MSSTARLSGERTGVAFLAAASMAYNQFVGVGFGVFLGAWLGAADYGVVNLARSLFMVTLVLSPLGLDVALQRSLGRGDAGLAQKAGEIAALRCLAAGLAAALALAVAGGAGAIEAHVFPYPHFARALALTMLALPFATDTAVLGGAYRGLLRPGANLLATYVAQPTARVALVLALALLCDRVTAAILGTTLSFIVAGLWTGAAARADFPLRHAFSSGAWRQARAVLAYAPALALANLAFTLARTLDTLTLGYFASSAEVGRYAIALTGGQVVAVIGSSIGQTLGGRVAAASAAGDRARIGELLRENMTLSSMASAPFCVVVALWGSDVDLLLGPSYALPRAALWIVGFTQWVMATTHYASYALSLTGRHRLELANNLAALVVQGVLALALTPSLGMRGAALSTMASVVFIAVRRQRQIGRMLDAPAFDAQLFRPLALSAAAAAPVYAVYAQVGFRAWWVTGLAAGAALALSLCAVLLLDASAARRRGLLNALMRRPRS